MLGFGAERPLSIGLGASLAGLGSGRIGKVLPPLWWLRHSCVWASMCRVEQQRALLAVKLVIGNVFVR